MQANLATDILLSRHSAPFYGRGRMRRGPATFIVGAMREVLRWRVLNLGKPKTPGQWMVHIVAALIALFLIAWLLRLYIL